LHHCTEIVYSKIPWVEVKQYRCVVPEIYMHQHMQPTKWTYRMKTPMEIKERIEMVIPDEDPEAAEREHRDVRRMDRNRLGK
jgi:hypothetical protein